jgi:hypothetical protein
MSTAQAHQNIHGQKIGIKYFLEKRVKPFRTAWGGDNVLLNGYPVYIQVTVKKQNTKFKSQLGDYVAPEHFDTYLRREDKKRLIEDERSMITRLILEAKPFDSQTFSLSLALKELTSDEWDIIYVIGKALKYDFLNAYREDLKDRAAASYSIHPDKQWLFHNEMDEQIEEEEKKAGITGNVAGLLRRYTIAAEALNNPFAPYSATLDPKSVPLLIWSMAIPPNSRVCKMADRYGIQVLRILLHMSWIWNCAHRLPTVAFFLSSDFDELFLELCGNEQDLFELKRGVALLQSDYVDLFK